MNEVKSEPGPSEAQRPQVPLPASIDLIGAERTLQVNHCRMPVCLRLGYGR